MVFLKYISLGWTGLKISVLGLGFWQAGSRLWGWKHRDVTGYEVVREIVATSIMEGINFYDTAEIYGGGLSEKFLGKAIRELGIRDQVVVVSKIAGFRYTYHNMLKAVKGISERLGFKPDIILHHWPPPFYVSICRVINNLEKLVDRGYVEYYGLSNYANKLLVKALECTRKHEPVLDQLHYNLGYRVIENNTKKILEENKIALIAWSPLAKGALAGLTKPLTTAQKTDKIFLNVAKDQKLQETLEQLSRKYNTTKSAIALAWLISKNAIPIPGTRKPKRIHEYTQATKIKLEKQDINKLDNISSKYTSIYGTKYSSLKLIRLVPGTLQHLSIKITKGI